MMSRGGNIPSDDIGYEEIYQFYVKQLKSFIPAESQNEFVIPDTFNDIINVENDVYSDGTFGIWKGNIDKIGNPNGILFGIISQNGTEYFIFSGESTYSDDVSPK